MDNIYSWKKIYIIVIDFVLPLPLTAVMWYAWYARTQSLYFASYVLLLGLCFGYIIPGIGTNVLNLWRFTWRFRMGNYFIHHGFLYAPYFALVLYVIFGEWERLTSWQMLAIIVGTGCLQSLISCHHDLCGVKIGMIEINNKPAREGKNAAEIICDWDPIGFFFFGASYAASSLYAYKLFVIDGRTSPVSLALLVASGVAFMGLTSVPYLIREWGSIARGWDTKRSKTDPAIQGSASDKGSIQ
jgi:hypothetical protein